MHSFLPYKDNPNKSKRFIGALIVVCFSLITAYCGQKYFPEPLTKAQVQQPIQKVTQESKTKEQSAVKISEQQTQPNIETIAVADSDKMATTLEEAMAVIPMGPRSKDPLIALTEAKIFAKPQIKQGKYIDVSLSHQNMVLFEDGKFVDSYLVSTGKASMPTPPGTYQIQNKVPRAWSNKYKLYMPYWMAITPSGEYGIHELPEWPGGYREGANHLGVPVSHGCVRLGVGAAKRVYEWADVGTTVIIHK